MGERVKRRNNQADRNQVLECRRFSKKALSLRFMVMAQWQTTTHEDSNSATNLSSCRGQDLVRNSCLVVQYKSIVQHYEGVDHEYNA